MVSAQDPLNFPNLKKSQHSSLHPLSYLCNWIFPTDHAQCSSPGSLQPPAPLRLPGPAQDSVGSHAWTSSPAQAKVESKGSLGDLGAMGKCREKLRLGPGEMAQLLGACPFLQKTCVLLLTPMSVAHNCLYLQLQVIQCLWPLWAPAVICIYLHKHTHIHVTKSNKSFKCENIYEL